MDCVFETEQRVLGEYPDLLNDNSLAALRKYKYSSVDLSPTSKYVLNPFWTWCAQFMPPWLAPNCITLIGISAIVLCNLLTLWYSPDLHKDAPSWLYFLYGTSLLFYQTMDNIDGKQARKTGTSSPLGELFDHGIDSLNCFWGSVIQVNTLGLGGTWWGLSTLVVPCLGMYFSSWETFYTKTLFLGYVNAPTEGLVVAALAHYISAYTGGPSGFWDSYTFLGVKANVWYSVLLVLTSFFTHIPACVVNVCKAAGKLPSIKTLTPIGYFCTAIIVWASGKQSDLVHHPILLGWMLSFVFGRMTTTIILSHLCNQGFPKQSLLLYGIYLGALVYGILPWLRIPPVLSELTYMRFLLVFNAVYFIGYSKLIIDKLCSYLGISCFTISHPLL